MHAEHDLDRLLPATTAAAFKINHAGQIVDDILAHPLVQAAEEVGVYNDALPEQQAAQLNAIRAQIKASIGVEWNEAITQLTSKGIVLAYDPPTNGVSLIIQGEDETLTKVFDILFKTIEPIVAARREVNQQGALSGYYYRLPNRRPSFRSLQRHICDDKFPGPREIHFRCLT